MDTDDRIIPFTAQTLARCYKVKQVRDLTGGRSKYGIIVLPETADGLVGYHSRCYKCYAAVSLDGKQKKQVDKKERVVKKKGRPKKYNNDKVSTSTAPKPPPLPQAPCASQSSVGQPAHTSFRREPTRLFGLMERLLGAHERRLRECIDETARLKSMMAKLRGRWAYGAECHQPSTAMAQECEQRPDDDVRVAKCAVKLELIDDDAANGEEDYMEHVDEYNQFEASLQDPLETSKSRTRLTGDAVPLSDIGMALHSNDRHLRQADLLRGATPFVPRTVQLLHVPATKYDFDDLPPDIEDYSLAGEHAKRESYSCGYSNQYDSHNDVLRRTVGQVSEPNMGGEHEHRIFKIEPDSIDE